MKRKIMGLFERKATYTTWFLSYCIIFMIPLCLGLISHLYAQKMLYKSMVNIQKGVVSQMRSICDGELEGIKRLGQQIAADPRTRDLFKDENGGLGEKKVQMKNLFDYLRVSCLENDYIRDIYLLMPEEGYLISTLEASNSVESRIFHYEKRFSMSKEEFWKYIEENSMPFVFLSDAEGKEWLYYFGVIVTDDIRHPNGYLLMQLDFSGILLDRETDSFQGILWDNSFLYDMKRGRRIFLDEEHPTLRLSKNPYAIVELETGRMLMTTAASDQLVNVSYCCGLGLGSVRRDSNAAFMLYGMIVLISMILCVLLARYLAKRNYNPVLQLVEMIRRQKLDEAPLEDKDVYLYLQEEYERLISSHSRMYSVLDREREVLVNNVFNRLMKGYIKSAQAAENMLDQYSVELPGASFHLVVSSVDDYSNLYGKEIQQVDNRSYEILHFLIRNIGSEYLAENGMFVYSGEADGQIFFLVSHDEMEEETFQRILKEAEEKTGKVLYDRLQIRVSWFCSDCCSELPDLERCYSECLSRMGIGETMQSSREEHGFFKREETYQELLRTGEYEKAAQELAEIFERMHRNSPTTYEAKSYGLYLFALTARAVADTRQEAIVTRALGELKLDEAEGVEILDSLVRLVRSLEESEDGASAAGKAAKILRYIDQNLYRQELSLADIAQHFEITEGYVTKLMKQSYGIRVTSYINEKRVDYMKKLMTSTSLSLQEISEKAGFYSYRTMIRIFKQCEGVLPSEFRKTLS